MTDPSNISPKEGNSIRIVLIRDYPLHGKKVIFDSGSTIRETLRDRSSLDEYDQVNENFGYKLLKSSKDEIKGLAELMFGNCPLTDQGSNFKVHLFENENDFMWSTLYNSSDLSILQSPNLSSSSVGSSFGNSISGIINQGASNMDLSLCDSGFCQSDSMEFNSCPSLGETSNPSLGSIRRQITGSTGSILPFRVASSKERRLVHSPVFGGETSFTTIPSFKIDSVESLKSSASLKPSSFSEKSSVLAIGIIFRTTRKDALFEFNYFLYELLSFISFETVKAYKRRREFIHSMFELSLQVQEDLKHFLEGGSSTFFRLEKPLWILFNSHNSPNHTMDDVFVRSLVRLRKQLDRKENSFLLSTFLTGILSHHLGWIDTVIPRDANGSIESEMSRQQLKFSHTFEPFQEEMRFWYNPQKHQYLDLHGKIGSNSRVTKTVLYSKDESLLKDLIFISSYFIRCSSVELKRNDVPDFEREDLRSLSFSDFYVSRDSSLRPPLGLEDLLSLKQESLPSKKSFILGDSPSPPDISKCGSPISCIEDEHLNLSSHINGETARIRVGKEVQVSEFSRVQEFKASSLPCLFQVGGGYMPGCIIQGIIHSSSTNGDLAEGTLQKHLSAMSTHLSSFIPELDSVQCLSVNLDNGVILLINSKKESLGKQRSPILFSPMIANILDAAVELASFGSLPVLMYIEEKLKEIYLSSKILADYLLSEELQDMSSLVYNLDLDYNDVPLLYSVAACHTPELSKKYGIGFA